MIGIASIDFLKKHRCFESGDHVDFRAGLNILVGDQGTGKSTVLDILRNSRDNRDIAHVEIPINVRIGGFDFEKSNPRVQAAFGGTDGNMPIDFQVQSMFASHGESNNILLKAITDHADCVLILDEPDQALSIRSMWTLCQSLDAAVAKNVQVICSAHNPILIMHAKLVYSFEHRSWMESRTFIRSQKFPLADDDPGA